MPLFRKKPVVISAEQYSKNGPAIDGVSISPMGNVAIETLEGWMAVSEGDWIITGVHNEKYPCKREIFEQTYEPVNNDR